MNESNRDSLEKRVLVLARTSKDTALTKSVLNQAGMGCACCSNLGDFYKELEAGAGVVVLPEEVILPHEDARLTKWLKNQPPWSDLPVLVMARPGADSAAVAQAMDLLGNVTVLERPMRVAALVSAARTALRARMRQYQIRDHLAERTRDEEALRNADRRKDEFLAILAHELRNPLAPVRSSLHVLRLTIPHGSSAETCIEMMERQVNHMVRLVDDLMEVSRITRGKIELRKEPLEVSAIARSAVETSAPLIENGKHRLTVSLPEDPAFVDGDSVRLAQVISNLLNNAAKYTDSGGQIWLTVRREDDSVVISVRDSGTGIPPEMLPRVFELFTQLDPHAMRSQGGLGIGLTLVKSLVEMHGGSVQARSEGAGRGSEFLIRLPLIADQKPANRQEPEEDLSRALTGRKVLVVDDYRDAAESLGMFLRLLGAEVHIVTSSLDAFDALASFQPSVVLLDIGMPGMNGYEVARRIRQDPDFRDVTLIALTGWGQEEDRRKARDAGFDFHLTKPVDLSTLQALLLSLEKHPQSH